MGSVISKMLSYLFPGLLFVAFLQGCSGEQLRRGTYYSIHEKQRQDCLSQGRVDCDQYDYDSYDEYQRKRNEE